MPIDGGENLFLIWQLMQSKRQVTLSGIDFFHGRGYNKIRKGGGKYEDRDHNGRKCG